MRPTLDPRVLQLQAAAIAARDHYAEVRNQHRGAGPIASEELLVAADEMHHELDRLVQFVQKHYPASRA